jgi:hypothetical protein
MDEDLIALHDGRVLTTHPPEACAGQPCCIHNPSKHPLDTAPLYWRSDVWLMERTCPHGIGHPDPDSVAYLERITGDDGWAVHGCDGCCQ